MILIQRSLTHLKELFQNMKTIWKHSGYKGLYRRYGWKLLAGFFCYYLVRDSIIYLILPYLIARHLIN